MLAADEDWAMRSDGEEPRLLKLGGRPLRLGLQVSIRESNGSVLPFRVASVR